jgi:hypothetical protein
MSKVWSDSCDQHGLWFCELTNYFGNVLKNNNIMPRNQCLSSQTLWVRIPLKRGVLDTTLFLSVTCSKSVVFFGYSTNETEYHDITEILLKVPLNTITLTICSCPSGKHMQYIKSRKAWVNTEIWKASSVKFPTI